MEKKRIVKDYENLPEEVTNQVKMTYPNGFADNLISFTNKEGKRVSALPFETDEIYYLIRMTITEAHQIIEDDEDYDEGTLRDDFADDVKDEDIAEAGEDDEDDASSFKKKKSYDDAYEMDDDDEGDEDEADDDDDDY